MVDVVISALDGGLQGPLSLRVVATLMAAEGIEHGAPERFAGVLTLLERLVSSGSLQVQVVRRMEPVPGEWWVFEPYDFDRHGASAASKIDPETGRAGEWACWTGTRPRGAVLRQREVQEKFIGPADMAAMLDRPVGEEVKALGLRSNALHGWLLNSETKTPTKMRRTDIKKQYEFATKSGEPRSFDESWKKVLDAGLKKDEDGLFNPDEADRIARGLRPSLMLREKGSATVPAGRAGASKDGTLKPTSWFPPP